MRHEGVLRQLLTAGCDMNKAAAAWSDPDELFKLRRVSKAWQRAVERHVLDVVKNEGFVNHMGVWRSFNPTCGSRAAGEKARQARRIAADWVVLAVVSHVRETGNFKCRVFVYSTTAILFGKMRLIGYGYFAHIANAMRCRCSNREHLWDEETRARWCKTVSKRVAAVLQRCTPNDLLIRLVLGMTCPGSPLSALTPEVAERYIAPHLRYTCSTEEEVERALALATKGC
jgi:hypothetical protein